MKPFQKKSFDGQYGSKMCSTCRRNLPLDRFGPNKKSADGLAYRCRECNRIRSKRRRQERTEFWLTHDPYIEHATKEKLCKRCETTKPVTEFSRSNETTDGLQRWCKPCQIDYYRRREYGRTLEEGGDTCAICGYTQGLCIDHCHRTGQTRGNLCKACNTALGFLNDDVDRLRAAIQYLEGWAHAAAIKPAHSGPRPR